MKEQTIKLSIHCCISIRDCVLTMGSSCVNRGRIDVASDHHLAIAKESEAEKNYH